MFKRFTIYAFILLFVGGVLRADRYSISAIDGSNFPEIKAYFQALDDSGYSIEDLTVDDFNVFEDGVSMDPSLKIFCEEGNKEVSVLLILDRSESMKDTVSKNPVELRWDWVNYAVTSFVNKINFVGRTTVAITNFGGTCKLTCPFTNQRQDLLDSLDKIQIIGKTLFDDPFLDATTGAAELFKSRPDDVRKVAIFLTDGEPTEQPKTDEIINAMQLANIQVYSITLNTPRNGDLNSVARYTGGESWRVDTKQELDELYNKIAEKLQNQLFCYLSWISPHGCDDASRYRNAKFEYLRLSNVDGRVIERPFILPEKSVPRLLNARSSYNLGMAQANETITGYVDFTPQYSDFDVSGARFTAWTANYSVDWEGRTLPFTIKEGNTERIKVVFKQSTIKVRNTNLILEGYPCEKSVPVVAGAENLIIDAPVGGESFSLCDSINILWSGINKSDKVILSYSTDNGNAWDTITTSASGLEYKWQAPEEGQYRLRADKLKSWDWTFLIQGTGDDRATGMHITNQLYAVGSFENTAAFGSGAVLKNSKGQKDYFVVSINPTNGYLNWVGANGGTRNDSATAVYFDNGITYVTGSAMDNCSFGTKTPNYLVNDKKYLFIAKHDGTGNAIDGNVLGIMSGGQNKNLNMWGTKVAVVGDLIYVEGEYIGIFDFGQLSLPLTNTPKTFTAIYNKSDLVLKDVKAGSESGIPYPPTYEYFDTYYATAFKDTISRNGQELISQGKSDGVIFKSRSKSSNEYYENNSNITVVSPLIEFNALSLDVGDCGLGNSALRLLAGAIKNNGSIPVTIESEAIANDPLGEFSITPSLLGATIEPGKSIDVSVLFTPQERGERTAQLLLGVDCLDPTPIDVKGNGQCEFDAKTVDFLEVAASVNKVQSNVCVFENLSNDSLLITPVIEGADALDFNLSKSGTFSVLPGECWSTDITCYSTVAGNKTAYINFNLHSECPDNYAQLKANVVITDVVVNDIDWGKKRLSSINDDKVILENHSNIDLKVLSFTNTNPSSGIVLTNPPAGFTIPANGDYKIDVSFRPTAEIYYESVYEFQVENAPETNTFKLSGTGVLPAYTLNWICPDIAEQGKTGTAYLEITNSGSAENLKIYDITISNGATDYTWISNVTDLDITEGATESLELAFTPTLRGSRNVTFDIISDALASADENPSIKQSHDFTCEVAGLLVPPSINFGNVLVCDDIPITVSVVNPSDNESVTISSVTLQNLVPFYTAHPDLDYTINPLDSMLIDVYFNPDSEGTFDDVLTISDSDNNEYHVQISGTAVNPVFYATIDTLTVVPIGGNKNLFGIKAKIPKLKYGAITNFKLKLSVNSNLVSITKVLTTKPDGFTWSQPVSLGNGIYTVEGSGNLATAFDDSFLLVEYQALLGSELVSPFNIKAVYDGCETDFSTPIYLAMNGICFNEGILISQGKFITSIDKVAPNPVSTTTELTFTTGYTAKTVFEIYDMQGKKIETLFDATVPSGLYNATLDVNKYNSGAYILQLRSGHITKTEKLMISK